jgi:hypothetical protein
MTIRRYRWPLIAGVCLLLPVLYISTFLAAHFSLGAGWVSNEQFSNFAPPCFTPLVWYANADMPGTECMLYMADKAFRSGWSVR